MLKEFFPGFRTSYRFSRFIKSRQDVPIRKRVHSLARKKHTNYGRFA
jgi:hypothetical protein